MITFKTICNPTTDIKVRTKFPHNLYPHVIQKQTNILTNFWRQNVFLNSVVWPVCYNLIVILVVIK